MSKSLLHLALLTSAVSCATSRPVPPSEIFVVAVAAERTLVGVARVRGYGGDLELKTLYEPAIDCTGTFNYDINGKGRANFDCTDKASGFIKLQSRGGLVGDGYGASTFGQIKALFGYSISEINRKMRFPGDRNLEVSEGGFRLSAPEKNLQAWEPVRHGSEIGTGYRLEPQSNGSIRAMYEKAYSNEHAKIEELLRMAARQHCQGAYDLSDLQHLDIIVTHSEAYSAQVIGTLVCETHVE